MYANVLQSSRMNACIQMKKYLSILYSKYIVYTYIYNVYNMLKYRNGEQTYTHISMYIFIYMYMYTRVYIHIYKYIYTCKYKFRSRTYNIIYLYVCICVCIYIYIYIPENTNTDPEHTQRRSGKNHPFAWNTYIYMYIHV